MGFSFDDEVPHNPPFPSPSVSCILISMKRSTKQSPESPEKERTTVFIHRHLLNDAKDALGVTTASEAIERALMQAIQQKAALSLSKWVMEPDATFIPTPRRKAL